MPRRSIWSGISKPGVRFYKASVGGMHKHSADILGQQLLNPDFISALGSERLRRLLLPKLAV